MNGSYPRAERTRAFALPVLGYGLALGLAETAAFVAGHGRQMPWPARAGVAGATLGGDLFLIIITAVVGLGIAAIIPQIVRGLKSARYVVVETAIVVAVAAPNAAAAIREFVLPGYPAVHPAKLAAYTASGFVALGAAAAFVYLRRKFIHKGLVATALVGTAAVAAAFFVLPDVGAASRPVVTGPDVIFISLDTVRADRLGCYGYDFNISPNLDLFAREAVLYENAVCTQPTTNPSHTSMFTGLYPGEHGVDSNFVPFRSGAKTVAELLRRHGYDTVAVTGGFPLDRRLSKLDRGFTLYDDYLTPWSYFRHTTWYRAAAAVKRTLYGNVRPAPVVTALAIKYLNKKRSRPLFLFVHYFDPHGPYLFHGRAAEFYRGKAPVDFKREQARLKRRWNREYKRGDPRPPFADALEALYADEIAYTDAALGDLIQGLKKRGGYHRTVVVVASDHGEAFGEHGYKYHGGSLYDEETRVCLLIKPAGPSAPGRRVRGQAETRAIPYTVLTAAGAPAADFAGLRYDLLNPPPAAEPPLGFSQTNDKLDDGAPRLVSARSAALKMIYGLGDKRYELYDLAADAAERRDLGASAAGAGYAYYRRNLAEHVKEVAHGQSDRVSGDMAKILKSLGYTD